MSIFASYQSRYDAGKEEEMSVQEYLDICKHDPSAYATAAERLLIAVGEPELVDTRHDARASRDLFQQDDQGLSSLPRILRAGGGDREHRRLNRKEVG